MDKKNGRGISRKYFCGVPCSARGITPRDIDVKGIQDVLTSMGWLVDNSMSVGEMQKHLRPLHCLYLPNEDPELVSRQEDGTLTPITLDELVKPIRTRIPGMMDAQIPTIIESINAA